MQTDETEQTSTDTTQQPPMTADASRSGGNRSGWRRPRGGSVRPAVLRTQTTAGFLSAPAPLYFERLTPAAARGDLLVLVHGGAHTGACYLSTPDGRPGWAYDFAGQGFDVLVVDWPGRGRSGHVPPDRISGELIVATLRHLLLQLDRPVTVLVHSMSGAFGFKLLEQAGDRVTRLVAVAPALPGNLQPAASIIEESDDALDVQGLALRWRIPKGADFLVDERILQVKLIGDGGRFPRASLDAYRASLVPIPSRLLSERQNVRQSQLRVAADICFSGTPILVVTGTHDVDHPREVDSALVDWLAARGAKAEFAWLADRGIEGNGHMMMLEDNSADVAHLIGAWVRREGG
jgi:pimeloyl-ACP methyl ester carboxylesterase